MIDLLNLSVTFGEKIALNNCSGQFLSGKNHALLGENGAGKSTLLKSLVGAVRLQHGSVNLSASSVDLGRQTTHRVIYHAQKPEVDRDATVGESLMFFGGLTGSNRKVTRQKCEALNEVFGCLAWRNKQVRQLSGGQRKRRSLMGDALIDPEYWLLDEPFQGLDDESSSRFSSWLSQRTENGRTHIISSHRFDSLDLITDQVTVLHQGHIVAQSARDQFIKDHPEELLWLEGVDTWSVEAVQTLQSTLGGVCSFLKPRDRRKTLEMSTTDFAAVETKLNDWRFAENISAVRKFSPGLFTAYRQLHLKQ